MRQSHIITLAAAALVGAVGGTTLALTGADPGARGTDPAGGTSSSAAPSAGRSSGEGAETQPLWATRTSIHDGDRVIDVTNMGNVGVVWRLPTGYLATEAVSVDQPAVGVYRVSPTGLARLVTFIRGQGDVDQSGRRFVGLDSEARQYRVLNIASGTVVQTVAQGTRPDSRPGEAAAFTPDGVVTEWRQPDSNSSYLVRTDENGDSTELGSYASDWGVSPTGDLLAGNTRNPDRTSNAGSCLSTGSLTESDERVQNCELRVYDERAPLSPSGSQVLAVPALTDGFGPGVFAVVDIATGEVRGEVELPPLALAGALLADDTVLVRASINDSGQGTVIYRCALDARCEEVERTEADGHLGIPR